MADNEQHTPTDEEMKMMQETTDAGTADNEAAATPGNTEAETAADTEKADSTAEDEQAGKKKKKMYAFMQQLSDYVNAEEDTPIYFDIKSVLGGDSLLGIVRRNFLFLSIITAFICVNISLGYMIDQEQKSNSRFHAILKDRQYKAIYMQSQLKERTLSSHIEQALRDSTLHTPTEQAYSLKVQEND